MMYDLWELEGKNQAAAAFAQFEEQYRKHDNPIANTHGGPFTLCGVAALFSACVGVFAPAVLHHVIDAFAALALDIQDLCVWLGVFFGSRIADAAMRRSTTAKSDEDADMSNLYASDVENILWAAFDVNNLWILPLQIAKQTSTAFRNGMKRKDGRMKAIKEVFGAIQIVKLSAWEWKFGDKIRKLRGTEFGAMTRYGVCDGNDDLRVLGITAVCVVVSPSEDLAIDEFEQTNVDRDGSKFPQDVAIRVDNGSFGWETEHPLLKSVNLTVKKGDLVVVHGTVGSGKSSLISALLGDMEKLSGSVFVRGRTAYYSQQAWIQNMTIRDNILFGLPYNQRKYRQVVEACGLTLDFELFPGGDHTEIGIHLSGGQKARVALARACYADADVLLDSPLAAVDAVVQAEIFANCICRLLEHKTVVLVTHAPDIIASDAVNVKIVVDNGQLMWSRKEVKQPRSVFAPELSPRKLKEASAADQDQTSNKVAGRLVDEEQREEGRVSKEIFQQYFTAAGGVTVCLLLALVQTMWQTCQISSDLWLSHWTGEKGVKPEDIQADAEFNMTIYALLGLGAALMVGARAATVAIVGLRASRHLFETMTKSLLGAPLRFFDANPIGRIVNRYSEDVSAVDFMLPFAYGSLLSNSFSTVCQLVTAVYMVNFLGVFIIPLVYLYVKIGNFYLAPSREVSRLLKVSSSPILSHVTQSEEGVAIIRAFGPDFVQRAIDENFARIDVNNMVWFAETVTGQWFQVRMQLLGCGVVIVIVSALVYLHAILSPGLIGLAFTYALSVDGSMSRLVRTWSWVEITMVSPERILEYATIPPEGSQNALVNEPSTQWPSKGTISFDNVVFSYKPETAPVLKGISFDIMNNEKIGIVGRTGAGKSSLTMALFRINKLVSGRITIDGVDISTVPLHRLRSRLSIIPQAPVLFRGTLHAYMDPFDEFDDAHIWSAFDKVELKDMASGLENQLSYELSENGDNFSVGERQMLRAW
ncbi:TPA: LOW QUALITY PROTEIN: hypothetical protein N0F65_012743 [Lagenidium giganteum]|uniref:Uncharacterized protein n=1 Tax=Lagenidium giganteum TaxID=4803 RepID=A0AAV2YGJ2_9STRA|nr:TPA: LOW QUALITY PROTEIN: hypothetical protein N0F65_012743 [Lagenidium giganteum]